MKYKKPIISQEDLLELIHFSRRYCDGRMTNVPMVFNEIYARLLRENPWIEKEQIDNTTKNFPYCERRLLI